MSLILLQWKLNLPLPEDRTEDELDTAVEMLRSAIDRLRADRTDTGGLDELREFANECHARHGGRTR